MRYVYRFNSQLRMESDRVVEAFNYAKRMHNGQTRKNKKDEYIVHPISVADHVRHFFEEYPNDGTYNLEALLMAAYLHDTIEDTEATYEEIEQKFGHEVASIVLELTNDAEEKKFFGKTRYLTKKMINMSDAALIIKLCDRLDNTSDLLERDESFRIRYATETYSILCSLVKGRKLKPIHLRIIGCINEQINKVITSNNTHVIRRSLAVGIAQ